MLKRGVKNKESFIIVVLLVIILSLLVVIYILERKQVVATVESEKIYSSELEEKFSGKYSKMILNELINDKLIDVAFKKNGLKYSTDELEENLENMKKFNYSLKDLKDSSTRNIVETYTKTRKVAPLYVISDDDLKKYVSDMIKEDGNIVAKTKAIYADDSDLKELMKLKNQQKILNIAEKRNFMIIPRTVFSKENCFDVNIDERSSNTMFFYDGKSETVEDAYSNKKALVLIISTEYAKDTILNIHKNKEVILDGYFSKNYYKVKFALVNSLRNDFDVEMQ